jgi:hypothetical protein
MPFVIDGLHRVLSLFSRYGLLGNIAVVLLKPGQRAANTLLYRP